MSATTNRPHVSPALVPLRRHVTALAGMVCACLVAQLLVVGFVHFTNLRWEVREEGTGQRALHVVPTSEHAVAGQSARTDVPAAGAGLLAGPEALARGDESAGRAAIAAARRAEALEAAERAGPRRVLGRWDGVLSRLNGLTCTVGLIAGAALAMSCMLGVVVAGGGGVPGVERAVSAAVWAVVLALTLVPWRDLLPSAVFPGVMPGYAYLLSASEGAERSRAGAAAFLGLHVMLPLAVLACACVVVARFRAGVEAGVVVAAPGEVEEGLEREMAVIRQRGVGSNVGAKGAMGLARVLGEAAGAAPRPVVSAEPAKRRGLIADNDRLLGEPDPGDPLKRPI